MLTAAGAYSIYQTGLHELNKAVSTAPLLVADPSSKPVLTGNTIKGPLNILMVGVDASQENTDSIIIAHIPASHDQLYLISLPRDTEVTTLSGGKNKINSTFQGGPIKGMQSLQKVIKNNYGITLNAGLIINFNGFDKIVDQLGGIDMYVDETTYSIHHGYINNNPADIYKVGYGYPYKINSQSGLPECSKPGVTWKPATADECTIPGVKEVVYHQGPHHFDAYAALDFVRCRDGLPNIDYDRQRHQQQFIKAVMQKAYSKGLSDPLQLLGLINSLQGAFTFYGSGIPIQDWLFTLERITPTDVVTIKTNGGTFYTLPDDGHGSIQGLNPLSLDLLNRVKTDNGTGDPVGAFITAHPAWVAAS